MKLLVGWRQEPGAVEIPPVELQIHEGRLVMHCPSEVALDEVTDQLVNRYFVEGRGFAVYRKDEHGAFVRAAEGDGLEVNGWVDMSAPAEQVLAAIRDAFLADDPSRYQVTEVP
jgi:hypothetical protein